MANTYFVSWSFSSCLNVLSSRAGLLHLWQLWDGKYHLQGMLSNSIPSEIIQNPERIPQEPREQSPAKELAWVFLKNKS